MLKVIDQGIVEFEDFWKQLVEENEKIDSRLRLEFRKLSNPTRWALVYSNDVMIVHNMTKNGVRRLDEGGDDDSDRYYISFNLESQRLELCKKGWISNRSRAIMASDVDSILRHLCTGRYFWEGLI